MRYKSRRSRATAISKATKEAVYERDEGCCIFCGRPGLPEAHYIPRSHGGLGIEQNIVTACRECHRRMDQTTDRPLYMAAAKEYLKSKYEDWNEEDLVFRKWGNE